MSSVTFPTDLGGDGSTVTDDNNPTTGLDDGGHVARFVPALAQTVVMARTAAEKAAIAKAAADAAAVSLATPTAMPDIRPSLLLDFANSESVDVRIAFSRASSAMRVNRNGLLESVAAGLPRLDYDRLTGLCLGLRLEESRTNLCLYSEQLDHATWSKSTSSVTANSLAAPDGVSTMDMITSSDEVGISQGISVSSGAVYCCSAFIKLNTGTSTQFRFRDVSGAGHHISIDTATGAIVEASNVAASGVERYQNNIVRVWMAYTTDTTTLSINPRPTNQSGSKTFYVWGLQVELGAFPTSYIPTTSGAVTRSADVASMGGTDFSAWFRASEGTIIVAGAMDYVAAGERGPYRIDDGTDNNRIMLRNDAGGRLEFRIISGNTGSATLVAGNTLAASTEFRHAGSYKLDSFLSAFNGGNALADLSGAVADGVFRLLLGELAGNGTLFMCGTLADLAFYPKQLTSTEHLAGTAS